MQGKDRGGSKRPLHVSKASIEVVVRHVQSV
jgi:hypothetical protein